MKPSYFLGSEVWKCSYKTQSRFLKMSYRILTVTRQQQCLAISDLLGGPCWKNPVMSLLTVVICDILLFACRKVKYSFMPLSLNCITSHAWKFIFSQESTLHTLYKVSNQISLSLPATNSHTHMHVMLWHLWILYPRIQLTNVQKYLEKLCLYWIYAEISLLLFPITYNIITAYIAFAFY
jgi:hypothetical protein